MKTKGKTLINSIDAISLERIAGLDYFVTCIWIVSPLLIIPLNIAGIDGYNVASIWCTLLYFSGGFSYLLGVLYFYKNITINGQFEAKKMISAIEPFIILVVFWLWCAFSVCFAEEKRVAIYGYGAERDSLFTYLFYGGIVCSGIVLSRYKQYLLKIANAFLGVSSILSLLSFLHGKSLALLLSNSYTTNELHRSVFFTTNDFAHFLVISLSLCIVMLIYYKNSREKWFYFALFLLLLVSIFGTRKIYAIIAVAVSTIAFFIQLKLSKDSIPLTRGIILFICYFSFSVLWFYTNSEGNDLLNNYSGLEFGLADKDSIEKFSHNDALHSIFKNMFDNSVVGLGLQNVTTHTDNLIFNLSMSTGIFGLLLFLLAFMVLLRQLINNWAEMSKSFIGAMFIIHSYLFFSLYDIASFCVAPYFYLVTGVCIGCYSLSVFEKLKAKNYK